jgi:hypothetical protein
VLDQHLGQPVRPVEDVLGLHVKMMVVRVMMIMMIMMVVVVVMMVETMTSRHDTTRFDKVVPYHPQEVNSTRSPAAVP